LHIFLQQQRRPTRSLAMRPSGPLALLCCIVAAALLAVVDNAVVVDASHFRFSATNWVRDPTNPRRVTFEIQAGWRVGWSGWTWNPYTKPDCTYIKRRLCPPPSPWCPRRHLLTPPCSVRVALHCVPSSLHHVCCCCYIAHTHTTTQIINSSIVHFLLLLNVTDFRDNGGGYWGYQSNTQFDYGDGSNFVNGHLQTVTYNGLGNYDWMIGRIFYTHEYANDEAYTVVNHMACCRIGSLVDGNRNTGMRVTNTVDLSDPTMFSPQMTGLPIVTVLKGETNTYRLTPPVYPNSITYFFADANCRSSPNNRPWGECSSLNNNPSEQNMQLDAATGIFSWFPRNNAATGLYVTQIKLSVANSETVSTIDFFFNLVAAGTPLPDIPYFVDPLPQRDTAGAISINALDTLHLRIRGSFVADGNSNVSVVPGVLPVDMIFERDCEEGLSGTFSVSNVCTVNIYWTPAEGQLPIAMVFATYDTNGFSSQTLQDYIIVYPPRPVIQNITPGGASTSGGTAVQLTGIRFGDDYTLPATGSVTVDGVECTGATLVSGVVTCNLPPGQGSQAKVVLTLRSVSSLPFDYQYAPPVVESIFPTSSPTAGNVVVTVYGQNLGKHSQTVTLGGFACAVVDESTNQEVECLVGPGAGTNLAVTIQVSGQVHTRPGLFSYDAPIVSFTQPSPLLTAGEDINIQGVSFGTPALAAVSVTIGGRACVHQTFHQHTHFSYDCTAPEGVRAQPLVITVAGRPVETPFIVTYGEATLATLAPRSGDTAGDSTTTLSGFNFGTPPLWGATTLGVLIGALQATVTPGGWNHDAITVDVPVGSGKNLPVSVCIDGVCELCPVDQYFSYAPPDVTSITPVVRPTVGGVTVTLQGTSFGIGGGGGEVLWLNGLSLPLTLHAHDRVEFLLPPGVGTVPFRVRADNQYSAVTNFEYSQPVITGIEPTRPQTNGLNVVTITGRYFGSSATQTVVYVNSIATVCEQPTFDDTVGSSTIECVLPAGQGAANLFVSAGGLANAPFPFVYAAPQLISFEPATATTAGNVVALLRGSNLGSVDGEVDIIGTTGTPLPCNIAPGTQSHDRIECTVPPGEGENLTVVYKVGSETASLVAEFSYQRPSIATVTPDATDTVSNGSTTLVILGSSFGLNPSATVGGVACQNLQLPIAHQRIECTAPNGTGSASIVVTAGVAGLQSDAFPFSFKAPFITDVSPQTIDTDGETQLVITGTDFGVYTFPGVDVDVTVGGNACVVNRVASTDSSLVCAYSTPAAPSTTQSTGHGQLIVVVDGLAGEGQTMAVSAPALSGMSPDRGSAGITVVISGFSLGGSIGAFGSSVSLGGVLCVVSQQSHTDISCEVPAGSGSVSVVVTVLGRNSNVLSFSYDPPVINNIQPQASLSTSGGTLVITGSNFGSTGSVLMGISQCVVQTANDYTRTSITCQYPPGTGTNVVVLVLTGTMSSEPFFVSYSAPTLTDVQPSVGVTGGGDTIVLTGSGFGITAGTVLVGDRPCQSLPQWTPTRIECVTPSGAGASLPASVLADDGAPPTTLQAAFAYAGPLIDDVSPSGGSTAGGVVVVTGSNLGAAGLGSFVVRENETDTAGGRACFVSSPAAHTDASVECAFPEGMGTVYLVARIGTVSYGFQESLPMAYAYGRAAVGGVLPPTAPTSALEGAAQTPVVLVVTGVNFGTGPLSALFPMPSVTVGGAVCPVAGRTHSSITCTLPPGTGSQKLVVVSFSAVSSTELVYFSYAEPTVTAATPATGPTSGAATTVTVDGSNFGTGVSTVRVRVGSGAHVNALVLSHTQLEFALPPGVGVDVTLTVDVDGVAAQLTKAFSYAAPVVTRLQGCTDVAASGRTVDCAVNGGTELRVTGVNFGAQAAAASSVTVGGNNCVVNYGDARNTHTLLVCSLPPGTGSNQNVLVTTASQASVPLSLDYVVPRITGIQAPLGGGGSSTGNTGGGSAIATTTLTASDGVQLVTLTGTGFGGVSTAVTITYGVVTGDPTQAYTQFTCVPQAGGSDTQVVCALAPGAIGGNLAFVVTDGSGQVSQPSGDAVNGGAVLSYPPVEIKAGSLSIGGVAQGSGDAAGASSEGETVSFQVKHVGTDTSLINVGYGPDDNGDGVPDVACSNPTLGAVDGDGWTTVTCLTSAGVGSNLFFQVTAGPTVDPSAGGFTTTGAVIPVLPPAPPSPPSDFSFSYPQVPAVLSVTGCEIDDVGGSTSDCPTDGSATLLTLAGGVFLTDSQAVRVSVGGVSCSVVTAAANRVTCTLPAGYGRSRAVVVTHLIDNGETKLNSEPVFSVSFKAATLDIIVGCQAVAGEPLQIDQCSRLSSQRITVRGENFGASRAVVLACGEPCANLVHTPGSEHTELECDLARGTLLSQELVVIQGGQRSGNAGRVSFAQCAAGSFQDSPIDYACTPCQAGKYSDKAGQLACLACDSGYYAGVQGGADRCLPCAKGRYSVAAVDALNGELVGASECAVCDEGTANESEGQSTCVSCEAGKFAGAIEAETCTPCAMGTYAPGARATTCVPCPSGSYAGTNGTTTCTACVPGQFSGDEAHACSDCGEGSFQASPSADSCGGCGAGQWQPATAQRSCLTCIAGRFSNGTHNVACRDCPVGRSSPSAAGECTPCGVGKFAFTSGSPTCTDCPRGRANPDEDQDVCAPCALGRYVAQSGQQTCLECVAGTYSGVLGAFECTRCARGSYAGVGESDVCTQCEPGRFNTERGMTTCGDCAPGRAATFGGQVSCSVCQRGYVAFDPGADSCQACLAGEYMDVTEGRTCKPCDPGWYQASSGQATCIQCPLGRISAGSGAEVCEPCTPGKFADSEGRSMCSDCSAGTFSAAGARRCDDCLPGTYSGDVAPQCLPCAAGEFQDRPTQSGCNPCLAGTHAPLGGMRSCAPCAPGTVALGLRNDACTPCDKGTAQSLPGRSVCEPCSEGYAAEETGQPECTICAAGKFAGGGNAETCVDCAAGRFSSAPGASVCTPCAAGSFADAIGSYVCAPCGFGTARLAQNNGEFCDPCTAGSVAQDTGQLTCTTCLPGKVQTEDKKTDCVDCPGGRFSVSSSQCDTCPRGTYSDRPGAAICRECVAGKYMSDAHVLSGALVCAECPAGRFGVSDRAHVCEPCGLNEYQSNSGAAGCLPCPPGQLATDEASTLCAPCLPGYYIDSITGQCSVCPRGHYCPIGEGDGQPIPCAMGTFNNEEAQVSCVDCPLGSFANATQLRSCYPCAAGSVASVVGAHGCEVCTPGRYSTSAGGLVCRGCSRGRFAGGDGATVCGECTPGKYQDESFQAACRNCTAGTFQAAFRQVRCSSCQLGFFSANDGAEVCDFCVAGRYQDRVGETVCKECGLGQAQATIAQPACIECEGGRYSDELGRETCKVCGGGKYAVPDGGRDYATQVDDDGDEGETSVGEGAAFSEVNVTAASTCTGSVKSTLGGAHRCRLCAPGRFQNGTQQLTCLACPSGKYQDEAGKQECIECQPGRAQGESGRETCDPCAPGTFMTELGQRECELCAVGSYADEPGLRACKACDAGQFLTVRGGDRCFDCEPGFFSTGGNAECRECGDRQIAPFPGASKCFSCDRNALTNELHTLCMCNIGFAFRLQEFDVNADASAIGDTGYRCDECPLGTVCDKVGTMWREMETAEGFWEATTYSQNDTFRDSGDRVYSRCLFRDHCVGGMNSECDSNRIGPLCARCDDTGDTRYQIGLNGRCVECPSSGGSITYFILVCIAITSALVLQCYIVLRTGNDLIRSEKRRQQIRLEQEEGFFDPDADHDEDDWDDAAHRHQQFYTIFGPPKPKPNFTYKLKIMLGFAQVVTNVATGLEVRWPESFKKMVSYLNPVNIDLFQFSSVGCMTTTTYYDKLVAMIMVPIVSFVCIFCFYLGPKTIKEWGNHEGIKLARRKTWKLVLFMLFLVYPTISSVVLRTFVCKPIQTLNEETWTIEEKSFLRADFSIVCGEGAYPSYAALAGIFTVLYPIGIPAFFFGMLYKYRYRLDETGIRAQLGFLYDAYTRDMWWFEMLDLGHKLLATSAIAFLPETYQMPAGLCITVAYLLVILIRRPYLRKGDDRLHLVAQSAIVLFLLAGHTFNHYDNQYVDELTDWIITASLFGVFAFVAFFFGLQIFYVVAKLWKTHRREKMLASKLDDGEDVANWHKRKEGRDELGIEKEIKRTRGHAAGATKEEKQNKVSMKQNPLWKGGGDKDKQSSDEGAMRVSIAGRTSVMEVELASIRPGRDSIMLPGGLADGFGVAVSDNSSEASSSDTSDDDDRPSTAFHNKAVVLDRD
jgi:hypothetical protein